MSVSLNNVTTSDGYTAANTLRAGGTIRLNIEVYNAAIYYRLGIGRAGIQWGPEVYCGPAVRFLDRRCDAIQVRSAVAGRHAQVTVVALGPGD